ncbi:MAG: ABC transporter permease [Lachnospiraceae bacterium]|nr:ABC transporter permease [Lachnospiraceae bacterium]
MRMLSDIAVQSSLRLKLFFKDRVTVLVLILSAVFFLFGMEGLNRGAEERASIPVGVLSRDESAEAAALVARLKELPALYVVEGSFEELEKELEDGYVRCILELREDYAERIAAGKCRDLITVHHLEGDNVATVIAGITAGEMMYGICLAQGYAAYEELPAGEREKYTREEYEAYTASLIGGESFDFAFRFRFVDSAGREQRDSVENSLFYRQATAVMASMLLALVQFTAMAGIQFERQQGISARRRLAKLGYVAETAGNLIAAAVLSAGMSSIFAWSACSSAGKKEKFFAMLWTTVLFSIIMALVYYFLARAMPELLLFQAAGALLLLAAGACGFLSLVEGVLFDDLPGWIRWVPNSVFLREFTRLML